MNKSRLEAFSDGVFSIVMTLLVFDIKVPDLPAPVSNGALWQALGDLSPLIGVYFLSFAVLSVFWINHHFLFHSFAKSVDRGLNLMNLSYLMFVAFVPFSAHFIGSYHTHEPAAIIYGLNIFIIVAISRLMFAYIHAHKGELLNEQVSQRLFNQARFRSMVSMVCYAAGICVSFVSISASLFLFVFPIVFNIIPGSLDLTEKIFGLNLD